MSLGSYTVRATKSVNLNNRAIEFDLHPTDNSNDSVVPEPGIEKNFVWKLTGPRPRVGTSSVEGESLAGAYYGSYVRVYFSGGPSPKAGEAAMGLDIVFTFEPLGSLVDGSESKALTFTPKVADLRNDYTTDLDHSLYLYDIRPGPYRLRAMLQVSPEAMVVPIHDAGVRPSESMDLVTGGGAVFLDL